MRDWFAEHWKAIAAIVGPIVALVAGFFGRNLYDFIIGWRTVSTTEVHQNRADNRSAMELVVNVSDKYFEKVDQAANALLNSHRQIMAAEKKAGELEDDLAAAKQWNEECRECLVDALEELKICNNPNYPVFEKRINRLLTRAA